MAFAAGFGDSLWVTRDDLIQIELDERERRLLRCGILEWGGPARCTDAMAIAIGFRSAADLLAQSDRLAGAVASGEAMSSLDWRRALLATEIAFASDVVGSGSDWSATTGLSDAVSLITLRSVQRKIIGDVRRRGD